MIFEKLESVAAFFVKSHDGTAFAQTANKICNS